MNKLANTAAYGFIFLVSLLSLIAILGVWEFFERDVISKSFQSVTLLAVVAVIVLIADRFVDSRRQPENPSGMATLPMPSSTAGFKSLRHVTLMVLIVAVVLLALVGVLAIWEVISGEGVGKSLASIGIIAFAAFVIVLTCLEREKHNILGEKRSFSVGRVFLALIVLWIFYMILSSFFGLYNFL